MWRRAKVTTTPTGIEVVVEIQSGDDERWPDALHRHFGQEARERGGAAGFAIESCSFSRFEHGGGALNVSFSVNIAPDTPDISLQPIESELSSIISNAVMRANVIEARARRFEEVLFDQED